MRTATLTAIVLFALPAVALAQAKREERLYPDVAKYTELNLALRASIPTGIMFDDHRWGDFYTLGLGLEAQYSHLWKASPRFYGGWYGGISLDSFGAKRVSLVDPTLGAVELRSERLNLIGAEFGFRFREDFKTFHFDQNIGIGGAFYSGTEIEQEGVPGMAKFIKASTSYLFTIGARVGAPVADGVEMGIGLAYRVNGPPKEGKDVKGVLEFQSLREVIVALTFDILF